MLQLHFLLYYKERITCYISSYITVVINMTTHLLCISSLTILSAQHHILGHVIILSINKVSQNC